MGCVCFRPRYVAKAAAPPSHRSGGRCPRRRLVCPKLGPAPAPARMGRAGGVRWAAALRRSALGGATHRLAGRRVAGGGGARQQPRPHLRCALGGGGGAPGWPGVEPAESGQQTDQHDAHAQQRRLRAGRTRLGHRLWLGIGHVAEVRPPRGGAARLLPLRLRSLGHPRRSRVHLAHSSPRQGAAGCRPWRRQGGGEFE